MSRTILKIWACVAVLLACCGSAAAQGWELAGAMPVPVAAGRALVLDGKIYILGGLTDSAGSLSDLVQIYDPASDTWLASAQLPEGRSGFAAALHGGEILVAGGMTQTMAQAERLQSWDLSSWRALREHRWFDRIDGNAAVVGERLILLGGYPVPSSSYSASAPFITEYDLTNNSFIHADSSAFPGEAPYQQMAAVWQGRIYLFGGVQFGISNKTWCYDPSDRSLARTLPNLLQPRAGGDAVTAGNGDIYLIGGYNENQSALRSVEVVQLSAGFATVANGPEMRYARRAGMAVTQGDYIYVFGGYDERGYIPAAFERLEFAPNTAVEEEPAIVSDFRLIGSYPNPFNNRTAIAFSLDRSADVRIEIYSVTGTLIKTLLDDKMTSGNHREIWNGTDALNNPLPSGLYICRLTTPEAAAAQKMTLIR